MNSKRDIKRMAESMGCTVTPTHQQYGGYEYEIIAPEGMEFDDGCSSYVIAWYPPYGEYAEDAHGGAADRLKNCELRDLQDE